MNFPENLRYTKDHEWISLDGNVATVGITDFAQGELGDIVYVDIATKGKSLSAEEKYALANFDKYRLNILNFQENEEQFHLHYRQIQVISNLGDWREFLKDEYSK